MPGKLHNWTLDKFTICPKFGGHFTIGQIGQYQHILSSPKFKKENKELKGQIAPLARLLAPEIVDPHSVEALVAC